MGAGAAPGLASVTREASAESLAELFSGLDGPLQERFARLLSSSTGSNGEASETDININALFEAAVSLGLTTDEGAANVKTHIATDNPELAAVWLKKVEGKMAKEAVGPSEEDVLKERKKTLEQQVEDLSQELQQLTGEMRMRAMRCPMPLMPGPEPPKVVDVPKEDVKDLEDNIQDLKSEIDRLVPTIELEVAGDPHTFAGWDNGGSTGYSWSYEVADNSVVQVFETCGQGRDTTTGGMCGGGRDFEYEFHGVVAGVTTVKVIHGRPWEPPSSQNITCFKLNVVQPDAVLLEEKLTQIRTKHEEVAASLRGKRPDAATFDDEIEKTSLGIEAFTRRKATYMIEQHLKVVAKEDEQAEKLAELSSKEKELDTEEEMLRLKISARNKQIDDFQDELQAITGEAVLREMECDECVSEVAYSDDEDPISIKRREISLREKTLQGLRDTLPSLDERVTKLSEQVEQAKKAAAEA